MNNGDYIPLDQEVIDQEVERLAQRRRSAKIYLAEVIKDKNTGWNFDIIVFHEAHKDFRRFKSIIKALEELRIFWCEIDEDTLVSRHELYDAVLPRK